MEDLKQSLEFPLKDLNLIGKRIYNAETNRYGMINGLFLEKFVVGGLVYFFRAYYDKIEHDSIVFLEDFHKGKIKFVIIDMPKFERFNGQQIDEIKEFMGNAFCNDMILHITEEEHKKHCAEQEWRGVMEIMGKAKDLGYIAADVVQDNYSMLKCFTLFINGIITENQMLYGLVNVLSSELKVKRDERLKATHEDFYAESKALLKEVFKELINEDPEKYAEIMKELK